MSQTFSKVTSFLKLRGKTIVAVVALLVIAAAIPFAIVDTIEKGRVYLFSSQFLEELPQRFSGSGRLRFILQPLFAILLGVRGGMTDVKAGNPPYLFGLLFTSGQRRNLLRSAGEAIGILLAMELYSMSCSIGSLPGSTSGRSFADWADSYLHSLCTVQGTDESIGAKVWEKVKNIKTFLKFLRWLIH